MSGTITISSGVTSSGVFIRDGQVLNVLSGGTVIVADVGFDGGGGQINVLSGGYAIDTIIQAGGVETISSGGTATDDYFNPSGAAQYDDGTAISTTLDFADTQFVAGLASAARIDGGLQIVEAGGTALATTVDGSYPNFTGNGPASSTEIVSSGSLASGTFLISSGAEIVSAGGTTLGTVISGGTLILGGTASSGIMFSGGDSVLEISGGTAATAISGFAPGDVIDLATLAYTASASVSLNSATDVLTVSAGGSSVALQLSGDYAESSFVVAADVGSGTSVTISPAPCFAAGTRIATARGEIAVEQLTLGDRVTTPEGETKPITWIGHRRVDCRRHPEPEKVWPLLVAAHAFGPGLPSRDLLLSPDHAVFAEGVLIPVKHLVNGLGIRQIATPAITYFHVELDRHAVILAEGLPVESYLDTGDRGAFENAEGPTALHPAFASARGDITFAMEVLGCAPLRVTGPEVEAVKARLAAFRRCPLPARRAAAAPG